MNHSKDLLAQGREEIRSLPRVALQQLLDSLRNGTLNPWHHEFGFHTFFKPSEQGLKAELNGHWRDPCEHFKCEQYACSSKFIRYIRSPFDPFVSRRPKKMVDPQLMRWEESVCGVTRLSMPEEARYHCDLSHHCDSSHLCEARCASIWHMIV